MGPNLDDMFHGVNDVIPHDVVVIRHGCALDSREALRAPRAGSFDPRSIHWELGEGRSGEEEKGEGGLDEGVHFGRRLIHDWGINGKLGGVYSQKYVSLRGDLSTDACCASSITN